MFLVSHLPITPSKRNSSTIQEWYLRTSKLRKLSVGFKSKTGRGASGRIVLFSKGSRCAKKVHRLMHCSFSGMFAASVIYEFQKNPLKNSTLALLCNSMGCWFYTPHISNMLQLGYTKLATAHIGIDFFG
jgi:ribosomal protein L2